MATQAYYTRQLARATQIKKPARPYVWQVGTQLVLARRGQGAAAMQRILDAQDCTLARFDVPGFGLYLEEIKYPEGTLALVQDERRGK